MNSFEAPERLVSAMIVSEAPPDAAQPRLRTTDIQEDSCAVHLQMGQDWVRP
jgi:hypothetical protein